MICKIKFQLLLLTTLALLFVVSKLWFVFLLYRYPDLKPPSSPSPNAPNTSSVGLVPNIDAVSTSSVGEVPNIDAVSTSSVGKVPNIDAVSSNGPAQLSVEDTPKEDGQDLHEPKSRPLSPYAM